VTIPNKPKSSIGNVSLYAITKTIDLLGADEFRSLVKQPTQHESVLALLGTASTDWQKEIYRNAVSTDHNISVSGKYDRIPYRFSAGYLYQDGILKTDNMQRTSIGVNINPSVFDDHLKINWNNKWMFIKNKFADNGAIGSAIQFDPSQPVTDENAYGGYWAWIQPDGKPVDQATDNPVARLNLRDDEGNALRYIGNVQLDYKFHFLPELRANLNGGYDYSTSYGTVFVPAYSTTDYYDGGIDRKYDQIKENSLLDFYLNYDKEVKSIASRFNIMGGYSWQHFYQENNTYNNDVAHSDAHRNTVIDKGEYYLVSFFGRFNYTLLDRYLLTFTLRDDGSSRFSKDTRWGLFPSAALAWKINEESFLKNVDALSTLKLRVGYGITGQQDIPGGNYPYLPRYTYSDQYAMYQLGNSYYYTLRPEGYDANIKWEETTTKNIGLDFGFLNARINGSVEYYIRETKDLINKIPVAAGTNLSNYIVTNVGDMENKGFEFDLNFKPVVKKDFHWGVGLNASANKNEITKLTANQDPSYVGVLVGGISGGVGNTIQVHSVGYPMYSFFVYQQVYGTTDCLSKAYMSTGTKMASSRMLTVTGIRAQSGIYVAVSSRLKL
jgi:iron complex outermembrane receptor protein